ncbi:MAG: Ger(x)C family spore germination protein [Senegalia sp. (in: firmicutes)]|uniref:Ger(x)C family spore germination protein n=2 Tax=Senegalia sp. (in: firmicutes) TaxID=1924098 RepID=UPI003F9E097B
MRKTILLLLILIITILSTACFDKHEIEDRAYILSMGIDDVEDGEIRFEITYEYPNLSAVGKNGQGEPRFTSSKKGRTVTQINRDLATTTEKDIFFNHLKVIVIGEELAKNETKMAQIMEFFSRTPDIGRKVIILIAQGKASDILNTELKDASTLGLYINKFRDRESVGGKYYINTLNDLLSNTARSDIALVGRISKDGEELKISGSSIIKNKKLITFLTEKSTNTASTLILTNKIYNDQITIIKDDGSYLVNYIAESYDVKKKLKIKNGNINITYNVEVEGHVNEYVDKDIKTDSDLLDDKKIKKAEDEINKKIKGNLNKTIDELQNEIGVDILQVEKYIREKEPRLWEKVKDDWDNEFQKIDFTVKVDSKIRRIGLSE